MHEPLTPTMLCALATRLLTARTAAPPADFRRVPEPGRASFRLASRSFASVSFVAAMARSMPARASFARQ
jgi:hypothetical protein